MCFTAVKKQEIMARHGLSPVGTVSRVQCHFEGREDHSLCLHVAVEQDSDELLKLVAKEWRALSSTDRAHWDEEARNDKVR